MFVLQNSAGAHIAAAVIGFGILALGDTAAAGRVDKVEGVVVVDAGNDAHVAHATAARTSLEEHEVTRLEILLLNTYTVKDLAAR